MNEASVTRIAENVPVVPKRPWERPSFIRMDASDAEKHVGITDAGGNGHS